AMTKAYLEGLGYRVLEASDGSEAVKISRKYDGQIDIIVTDLRMPTMRGDAAVNSIRKHRPGIKALYMSGSLGESGAHEYRDMVSKPFKFPELGHRIRLLLDDQKLQRPA